MKSDASYGSALLAVSFGLAYLGSRGDFWLLLLWPSVSFLISSLAYFCGSVRIFGKRESGDRSPISALFLSAFTLYVRALWEVRTRFSSEPPWQAVSNSLLVSRRLRSHEFPDNISAVVDLTSEFLDPQPIRSLPGYCCIPILDGNALTPEVLAERVRCIPMPTNGRLLIHCANGHSRGPLVAAAWLIAQGLATSPRQALALLQSVRPRIHLRRCQREALEMASHILVSRIEPAPGTTGPENENTCDRTAQN